MSVAATDLAVLVTCLAASAWDLRTRRIPNLLTGGAALAGVLYQSATGGWTGLQTGLLGLTCGLLLFLPFFLLRGMGAGDVKLLAALGAWLGPLGVIRAAFFCAIMGGILALWLSARRGYLRTLLRNVRFMVTHWTVNGIRPIEGLTLADTPGPRLPYAIPISVGAVVAICLG